MIDYGAHKISYLIANVELTWTVHFVFLDLPETQPSCGCVHVRDLFIKIIVIQVQVLLLNIIKCLCARVCTRECV